jgi:hypothetical protein
MDWITGVWFLAGFAFLALVATQLPLQYVLGCYFPRDEVTGK